ncbi:MAG: hypothetical protein ACP5EK_05450, partial [Thermoplasmatota archaeon]
LRAWTMISARTFARSLLVLAQVCARDPEQVDPRILAKLQEFGYIDEKGRLTPFGRKIVAYIVTHRREMFEGL